MTTASLLRHYSTKVFGSKSGWRVLLIWVGAIFIGLAALALGKAAFWSFSLFETLCERWWWWPFLSLPLGGMAVTWFILRVGPGTEGSGIQQVIAALEVAETPARVSLLVNLRLACAKFLAIVAGVGSGFVLGLEGPTVQIGASILYSFRRFLRHDSTVARRQLLLAGGAAGIAAAFNAPMAGLMFAFEEMSRGIGGHTSGKLIIAIVLAGTVAMVFSSGHSYFGHVILVANAPPSLIPLLLAVALTGGVVGGGFSWLAVRASRWLPRPLQELRTTHPYRFVILCGLLIALCGLAAPIYGSGTEITTRALHGELQLQWYYLPLKFTGLLATVITGLPGGIFSPSLSLGAGVASWFLAFADPAWQGEILGIGMVAVLAAVTRAPLTAAFIIIEMTDGHIMILEALAAALLAARVARYFHTRFYHELTLRALHGLPDNPLLK